MQAIVCEHCDSVHARVALPARAVARCQRCDAVLYRASAARVDHMLAVVVAAAIAFVVAVAAPVVSLAVKGSSRQISLGSVITTSWDDGLYLASILVASTVLLVPLLEISLFLAILLPLRARRRPAYFVKAMHLLRLIRPWSMVEVFLLGVLVAYMKLSALATVDPDAGVIAVAALTALLVALSTFDQRDLWDQAWELRA